MGLDRQRSWRMTNNNKGNERDRGLESYLKDSISLFNNFDCWYIYQSSPCTVYKLTKRCIKDGNELACPFLSFLDPAMSYDYLFEYIIIGDTGNSYHRHRSKFIEFSI